ncbi:MAG TPA: hypothetical protein VM141_11870 [Planctomycetota bacterium]|nr:hypothetical protein [Planctomycetota bacterium]
MFSQEVRRSEVHIETTAKAAVSVEQLLGETKSLLNSETRACRKTSDGGTFFVVVCDREEELDRLLFRIEKIRGAVVHECHCP